MFSASGCDLLQVLRVRITLFLLLGNGNRHVAGIFNYVPEGFETGFQAGHAHGGRPHVHTSA